MPERSSLLPNWNLARRLLPITAVSVLRGLFIGVVPFVPLYLEQVDKFTGLEAGFIFSLTLGAGILSQTVFGYLEDKIGKKVALGISNAGCVVFLLLFVLSSNPALIDIILFAFGMFSYSGFPLLMGVVNELTEFGEMTRGGAIVWGIGNASGSVLASLLIGLLALPFFFGSLTAGFLGIAFIGVLSVVLIPLV